MTHFRFKINTPLHKQGSALIAIIAAIAIFSVLAAALMTLTSTSEIQTAIGHWADQAFYMAESGYRYAKTQYQSASESTKMTVFDTIDDNSPYSIHNTDNSFSLETFSYFFVVEENTAIADPITVKVHSPGGFPYDNMSNLQNQKIQIEETVLTIQSCVTAEGTGNHTLTLLSPSGPNLSDPLPAGTILMPVIESSTSQTINSGGNISIPDGLSNLFPLYNGTIRVAGRTLTYRVIDSTNNILSDVVSVNGSTFTNLSIASGSKILLLPFVNISSTGIVGHDSNSVHRTVNYYSPLPIGYTETYSDTFSGDTSILKATTDSDGAVTMEIGSVGEDSNKVFKVTGSIDSESHAYLDVEGNAVARNAQEAFNDFRSSTGGYLSYDAQTKVGFYSDSVFVPNYYESIDLAAGLSFRIRSEIFNDVTLYSMYGLSFLNRITDSTSTILDDITPPELSLNEPAIVLWQQINDDTGTTHYSWLAYKKLVDTVFYDDFTSGFDDGVDGVWTDVNDNWQWDQDDESIIISTSTPMTGEIYFQTTLPIDENNGHPEYTLSFEHGGNETAIRNIRVYISGDTEPIYSDSFFNQFNPRTTTIPLPYAGNEIVIDFYFQNVMGSGSWRIDNVKLTGKSPIQNSTLIVRIKEAAIIPFNYNESETFTFNKGEQIFGDESSAFGRLITHPILNGSNNPQGYLLLNSVSSTQWFDENEGLTAWGKGSIAHIYGVPDETINRKSNIIKAFYATENGLSDPTPDESSPLDCYMRPYKRLSVSDPFQWPVQDGDAWTANRDYFQVIQWDAVNINLDPDLPIGIVQALTEIYNEVPKERTIIFSHHDKLKSSTVSNNTPELGLHAMGGADGTYTGHVYFDDFGFQLYYPPMTQFPTAFQQ